MSQTGEVDGAGPSNVNDNAIETEATETTRMVDTPAETNRDPPEKKKDKPTSGRKYMKRTTLTILLGILNVFLLAILIFIIAFFVKDKSQRVIIKPSRTFCLSCDEISIHPDDDPLNFEYFVKRTENGKDICCTDEGQHLDKMMELYVERKHAIKAAETNTQELEAACHNKVEDFEPRVMARVAGIRTTTKDSANNHHVVRWESPGSSGNSLSFKRNITYNSYTGEFVISTPGYYYVYSQVTVKATPNVPTSSESLCHYIYRSPDDKLLENSRTLCKFQGSESKSTSYLGAVFNLMKDDKIKVQVTDPNVLIKEKASTYFGLHMI